MVEPSLTLPPELAKWLASRDAALVAKAHAALQAAEPDANDLLLAQIKSQQKQMLYTFLGLQGVAQMVFQMVTGHRSHLSDVTKFCVGVPLTVATLVLMGYVFLRPMGNHWHALICALARRGDLRAISFLLQLWVLQKPRLKTAASQQAEIEAVLLTLLQNTEPGKVNFSPDPKAQDATASLRHKFNALTRKRKGNLFFSPKATVTPRRVQLWLTLLPHLAADANPKSQAVLRRIADARAQTLQEELIQNDARVLLNENKRFVPPQTAEATGPQTSTVIQTDAAAPAQIQRVGKV